MCISRSLNTTALNGIRSGKSEAYVTNDKRLRCTFLPRDAMHKRGLCCHAVYVRRSVCLSVCVSATFVSCVKTNKDIFEIFSPSGSQVIIEFYALVNLKPQ